MNFRNDRGLDLEFKATTLIKSSLGCDTRQFLKSFFAEIIFLKYHSEIFTSQHVILNDTYYDLQNIVPQIIILCLFTVYSVWKLSKANGYNTEMLCFHSALQKPSCVQEWLKHLFYTCLSAHNFTVSVQQPFDCVKFDTEHPVTIRKKGQHKEMSRICLNLVFRR